MVSCFFVVSVFIFALSLGIRYSVATLFFVLIKLFVTMSEKHIIKKFLTAEEAAEYMGITMSYLYKLTHLKMIPYTRPFGKKIYFEREALDAILRSNPVRTEEEVSEMAQSYCMGNRKIASCDNLLHNVHNTHNVADRKGGAL